jgi:hypothetical protein
VNAPLSTVKVNLGLRVARKVSRDAWARRQVIETAVRYKWVKKIYTIVIGRNERRRSRK